MTFVGKLRLESNHSVRLQSASQRKRQQIVVVCEGGNNDTTTAAASSSGSNNNYYHHHHCRAYQIMSLLLSAIIVLSTQCVVSAQGNDGDEIDFLCSKTLSDGTTRNFEIGESFGDLVQTRCNNPLEYPCYCNPDSEEQAYCPYCGFLTNEGVLYCAEDGGTIQFPDGSLTRECTCEIPADFPLTNPIRSCTVLNGDGGGAGGSVEVSEDGLSCVYKYPDGTEFVFFDGESFSSLVAGDCGSGDEWPAFCNTVAASTTTRSQSSNVLSSRQAGGGDDSGNIFASASAATTRQVSSSPYVRYPYCVFPDTNDSIVKCARDQDDVTFMNTNNRQVKCSCSIDIATGLPISSCEEQPEGVIINDSCSYTFPDGAEFEFSIGESFATLVEGPCGSGDIWPAFCTQATITTSSTSDNSTMTNNTNVGLFYNDPTVSYPYCIFDNTFSGDVVCANDQQDVSYQNDSGGDVTCTCSINEETGVPDTSCTINVPATDPGPSPATTPAPTANETSTDPPKKSAAACTSPSRKAVLACVSSFLILQQMLVALIIP